MVFEDKEGFLFFHTLQSRHGMTTFLPSTWWINGGQVTTFLLALPYLYVALG